MIISEKIEEITFCLLSRPGKLRTKDTLGFLGRETQNSRDPRVKKNRPKFSGPKKNVILGSRECKSNSIIIMLIPGPQYPEIDFSSSAASIQMILMLIPGLKLCWIQGLSFRKVVSKYCHVHWVWQQTLVVDSRQGQTCRFFCASQCRLRCNMQSDSIFWQNFVFTGIQGGGRSSKNLIRTKIASR